MAPQAPKMVLFDYGQTLIDEPYFNKELGMAAVLAHADANPLGKGEFSMAPQAPKMVLFDYGQTLIDEPYFNKELGMAAVLAHADANPLGRTARELADCVDALEEEMERFRTADGHIPLYETHNLPFQRYVFASQRLSFSLPGPELERLYWDAAAPGRPTEGIRPLLDFLAAAGIRTGVISNRLSFSLPGPELERLYWDAAAPGRPTEGIRPLLDFLAAAGIRTGVISNLSFSGDALRERLDRLLPNHRFEFILATSEYVFRKPSPRIFRLALTMAGLEPDEVWYCGDNPVCDIDGAAACGIQPVWYTGARSFLWSPDGDPTAPHLSLDRWSDFPALLPAGAACSR